MEAASADGRRVDKPDGGAVSTAEIGIQTDHVIVTQPGEPLISNIIQASETAPKQPIAVSQLLAELAHKAHEMDIAKATLEQADERERVVKEQHAKD